MRSALVIPLLLVAAVARGQESPADRIGPYLTEGAIAVGRLDLDALNVDAAFERLKPFFPAGPEDAEAARRGVGGIVEAARAAGMTEIFAVLDMQDIPNRGIYLVVPLSEQANREAVLGLLEPTPFETKEVIGGAVVAGSKAVVERLKSEEARAERPGLAEAFAAAEDRPVQVVLAPSKDQSRVLREMLPDLPPEYGGATGEQLAAGLRWASLGVSFEPKLSAKVVVQSESEQAAEALKAALTEGLQRLSTQPEVVAVVPVLPMLAGTLVPAREGDRLVLVADESLEAIGKMLSDLSAAARSEAGRSQAINNLKQIGLAMHNFHDTWGSFPPSASYDGETPLLSWRVYLLPWLEQQALYDQFRLDEPWDSEHNRKLIEKMPEVFRSPNAGTPPGHTVFLVPVGGGLVFDGKTGTSFREITDGTSNTALVVEATADRAVPWTKPEDLSIDPQDPLAGLKGDRDSFAVLYGDGSVRRVSVKADPETFYDLLTRGGGEVIDDEKLQPE